METVACMSILIAVDKMNLFQQWETRKTKFIISKSMLSQASRILADRILLQN